MINKINYDCKATFPFYAEQQSRKDSATNERPTLLGDAYIAGILKINYIIGNDVRI
jgi:hypothetical protein